MHDLSYSSFDSGDMPHFEKGSLIKLENGDCKKVEELSRDDFEKVNITLLFLTMLMLFFYSAARTVLISA